MPTFVDRTPFMWLDKNIVLVTLARFVARMGGEAAFFIGVWGMAAYRFHATPAQIATIMAALAVSSMVGSAVAGSLVDRFGPRNVLVGAQVLYVPIVLAMSFVTSIDMMVAACALFGLSTSPIMTATGSFAPYLTRDEERIEKVNALLEGVGALSFVVGPAAGALVAAAFRIEAVFYLDAVLTTLGMLLVIPVRTPPLSAREHGHPLREVIDGLKVSYSLRAVRYYVLLGTLVWFSFGAFGALEPLFFRDVVGTGVETIGWVNSLFGLGIGAGAFLLTRLPSRFVSARGLAVGVMLVGLGAVLYIGTPDLRVIGIGALVWGTVIGAVEPLLRTLLQLDAPEEYVGRVMGTAQLHRGMGELVPLALAPTLAALFGVQAVMIGGGVLAAVLAAGSLSVAASIDRTQRHEGALVVPSAAAATDEPINPIM